MMLKRLSYALLGAFLVWVMGLGAWYELSEPVCSIGVAKDAVNATGKETWCFEFWLNRYQTALAAILALLAALGTAYVVRQQIKQADRHEDERYGREGAAARAVLPLSLSTICQYAEISAQILEKFLPNHGEQAAFQQLGKDLPDFPVDAVAQLGNVIKTIPVVQGRALAAIIAEMQVFRARTEGMIRDRSTNEIAVREYILDAVEIYARCYVNFDYARTEAEAPCATVTAENMKSACAVMRLQKAELFAMIDRRPKRYPL